MSKYSQRWLWRHSPDLHSEGNDLTVKENKLDWWKYIVLNPSHLLGFYSISACWVMKDWLLALIITRHYSYEWKNTLMPKPSIQPHKSFQKNYPLGWNYLCFVLLMLCSPHWSNLFFKSIIMHLKTNKQNPPTHTHTSIQKNENTLLQNVILWSLRNDLQFL